MSGTISNVLELMRLESGQVKLRRDWLKLPDDLVNSALERVSVIGWKSHPVNLQLPDDFARRPRR